MPGQLDVSGLQSGAALKYMVDPVARATGVQALQGQMLQNRLLGQEVGSKLSMGKAFGSAIDADGNFDPSKVAGYYPQHPNESQFAPAAIAGAQTQANAQLQQQILQLQQHRESLGLSADQGKFLSAAMLPRIQEFSEVDPKTGQPKQPTSADLQQAYVDAITNMGPGVTTTALARAQKSITDAGDDPAKILAAMKGAALIGNPTPETLGMLNGPVVQTNVGNQVKVTQTSPLGGPVVERGALDLGTSPETRAALVDWTDPDTGKVYKVPRGALGDMAGGAPSAGGGARNGRYPGAGAGSALGAGAPPGAVAPGALPPGTPQLMEESAKTYMADVAAVPNLRRTMVSFDQAFEALKAAKTGPGAESLQKMRGVLDTFAPGFPLLANKPEAEAYAEANKWLTSVLTSEAQRLNLGTDQGRALQGEAQPGVHTVHGAAIAMIPVLKGLKAFDLVAPILAQKAGVTTPQKYVEWRSQLANKIDMTALAAPLVPAAERKAKIAKMTPDQKTRYAEGLRSALAAGLFTADDLK